MARFDPAHRDEGARRALSPAGDVLVGYVGRLAPEKDVALLEGLRGVRGIRLVVVGDGPDRTRLARRLPGAVFTGYKGGVELSRLFASLDVFVHTGAHETFCQTIQESLASGVPVVAPAIGGPLDLVRHGTNGVLYRPGDRRALRRAVTRMADDERGRQEMAAAARPGVVHRTWPNLTRGLVGHYRRAMAGHAAGRPTAVGA